jgi:hypothetical protein
LGVQVRGRQAQRAWEPISPIEQDRVVAAALDAIVRDAAHQVADPLVVECSEPQPPHTV